MGFVFYIILFYDNLNKVFLGIIVKVLWIYFCKLQLLIVLVVLVVFFSLWFGNFFFIFFLLIGGIFMLLIIFFIVVSIVIFEFGRVNNIIFVLYLNKIFYVFGFYVFSYVGYVVFFNIYKDMKDFFKYIKVDLFLVIFSIL